MEPLVYERELPLEHPSLSIPPPTLVSKLRIEGIMGLGKYPGKGPKQLTFEEVEKDYYLDIKTTLDSAKIPLKFTTDEIVEAIRKIDHEVFKKRHEKWIELQRRYRNLWDNLCVIEFTDRKFLFYLWDVFTIEEKIEKFCKGDLDYDYDFFLQLFLRSELDPNFLSTIISGLMWDWVSGQATLFEVDELKRNIISMKTTGRHIIKQGKEITRADFLRIGRFKGKKAEKALDYFSKRVNQISKLSDLNMTARELLYTYIDAQNSDDVNDLRAVKEIKIDRLDMTIYKQLLSSYVEATNTLRGFLFENYYGFCCQVSFLSKNSRNFLSDIISAEVLGIKGE